MAFFMKEFEHLKIALEEIKTATENFDERRVIGNGGFGKVYKGELSHSNRSKNMFAIKRLDPKYGQGDAEFYKEIRTLCCYRHENLISLQGFCKEEGETILVYEYASRGSLDHLLSDVTLTWTQRIKICLDAAKGLSFLHDPNGTHQRVLHCDLKSANILLDNNMTAKVSDFGLSKMGPASQQYSHLVTNPVGTPGYCDPLYMYTYCLTKESDVYSFGVVLFEVLCGRLCAEYSNGQFNVHVPFWKTICQEKKLNEIIFRDLVPQINPSSLEIFADIAYQCLHNTREERPAMSLVVKHLKVSLDFQEGHGHYEDLVELKVLLPKGVLLDGGKTRLFINEKEQHVERIYIEACLELVENKSSRLKHLSDDIVNSRFPKGRCYQYGSEFKALVRGQYLTPQIPYTVNLVFRYLHQSQVNDPEFFSPLRYNILTNWEDETKVFIIYPTDMRQDGWFIVPLYHFTSQHTTARLQFDFDFHGTVLLLAGFEFQPSEKKVELPVFEEYQHIVEDASQSLFYTSLPELKQILRTGIHLKDYKTWFSINKKGEHCHMISMKDCLIPNQDFTSHTYNHTSRFPAGFYQPNNNKGFKTHVKTQLLSPSITYTVNLVFKSSNDRYGYVGLKYRLSGEPTTSTVYLGNRREESYMYMAELYQFTSDGTTVDLEIDFDDHGTTIDGVEGILFQPLEIVEYQVSKDDKVENIQTISDSESDTFWEQKFPNDYEEILNLSKESLMWTTKKELYSILRRGFLINNGQEWFTVDKHGKKCLMLSARATWVIDDKNLAWKSLRETRFGEVLVITAGYKFKMNIEVKSEVSPDTTYAAYFVYKLPKDQFKFAAPLYMWDQHVSFKPDSYIYLVSPPNTPFIGPYSDENTHNPLNRYKGNGIPQQRTDGWMEVKVWELQTTTETVSMRFHFEHSDRKNLKGLMVEGIELRPI